MDCEIRFFVCQRVWPRTQLLLTCLRDDIAAGRDRAGDYAGLFTAPERRWFSPLSDAESCVVRMLDYDADESTLDAFGIFPHRSVLAACRSVLQADIRIAEIGPGRMRYQPDGLPYGGPDGLLSLLAAMGHIVHYVREVGLERSDDIEIFGRPPSASPLGTALRLIAS